MNNTPYRQIGLFFYFVLPEESMAMEAATEASIAYNNSIKELGSSISNSHLIKCCHQTLKKVQRIHKKHSTTIFKVHNLNITDAFHWPENVDKGPWLEFRRKASTNELTAVTWSAVLKNSDSDIANGLGITEGTVRYRIGKGLMLLGSLNRL